MSTDIVLTGKQNTIQGERYFEKFLLRIKIIHFAVICMFFIAETRTADELVQMIAHFYYNAKKPSCINNAALSTRV